MSFRSGHIIILLYYYSIYLAYVWKIQYKNKNKSYENNISVESSYIY